MGASPSSPAPFDLRTPLTRVRAIGTATADALATLSVHNVAQLIAYLPFRHEQVHAESPIATLTVGHVASARGEIAAMRAVRAGRGGGTRGAGGGARASRVEAVLLDDSGRLDLVWFGAPYIQDRVHPGSRIRVQGKVRSYRHGLQMVNPSVESLDPLSPLPPAPPANSASSSTPLQPSALPADPAPREARIRPVYPATEAITSSRIERAVAKVLDRALPLIDDHLDESFRSARSLPSLRDAYAMMHRPETLEDAHAARRRLAYDELLFLQVALALKRRQREHQTRAPALRWSSQIDARIRARLPFTLTDAQNAAVADIAADLQRTLPANRLLQGDVGSGKTAVALYAMLMAAASGAQAALMAPTEILAEQHHAVISNLLAGARLKPALLTSALPAAQRARLLASLYSGETSLVVGTHALLTSAVRFANLALLVIDEQHRFGVAQRAAIQARTPGTMPHVLVMTATPIPRTLALTLLGDLDVSTIRALPPGRKPVRTRVVTPDKAPEVYAWLRTRLDKGEQAFVVAPTIDPADDDHPGDLASIRSLHAALSAGPLAGKRLDLVHGRLDPDQRAAVMARFRAGTIDVLIATTVIEVGVDIPNATVMVIEHAERFGLAQLHQLRGRVGRGTRPGVTVCIATPITPESQSRLAAFSQSTDGFKLAEADFAIRGFGDIIGTKQAGMPAFRVAAFPADLELLRLARTDARALADTCSGAPPAPPAQLLYQRVIKSHGTWLAVADTA